MTTTLTANDRCDRCSARAAVRYDLNGLDLLLCGHHNRQHGPALREKGASLVDDVDALGDLDRELDRAAASIADEKGWETT